jgi:hypothetical protein
MGNSLDPETALQLYQAVLYCMGYIFAGAAVIGLSVYIVLVCSEMFFSQPRSKTQRAKAPQWACPVPVVGTTLDLSANETPILAAPEDLGKEVVRVNTSPRCAQMPTTVPATLQSAPTGSEVSLISCGFGGQSSTRSVVHLLQLMFL